LILPLGQQRRTEHVEDIGAVQFKQRYTLLIDSDLYIFQSLYSLKTDRLNNDFIVS